MAELIGVTGVHNGGDITEAFTATVDRAAGAVHDLLDTTGGEELGAGGEVTASSEGDLDRALGQAAGDAGFAAFLRPDEQARVVSADGVGADEDGVATGPDFVDPVEVFTRVGAGVEGAEPLLVQRGAETVVAGRWW